LLVSDPRCRLRAVDLPSLAQDDVRARSCSLTPGFDGFFATDAGVPSPLEPGDGTEVRRIVGGDPETGPMPGEIVALLRGCAPAWTPEGRLTLVRRGEVVDIGHPELQDGEREIVSREALDEAFVGPPWDFARPRVRETAWMDDLLAAVVGDAAGGGDVLALIYDGRVVATTPSPYEGLSRLRVSPRGTYVAAQIGVDDGLVLLARDGEFVPLGVRGHAVTWSRDEAFTAVAADDGIYVFETGGRANRFARLRIAARDLVWL
jgi:hypothetical protein